MANVWRELRGVLGGITQWGLSGFNLKNASGVAQIRNAGDSGWGDIEVEDVRIHSTNATFAVILQAPAGLAADLTITLPPVSSAIPSSTGLHYSKIVAFTQASGSPLTLDAAPPANATLEKVRIVVDTAASGGSPTIAVGIAATPALYSATTDSNLKAVGQYINDNFVALGATPGAIIATIVTSSQTFVGRIELSYILA